MEVRKMQNSANWDAFLSEQSQTAIFPQSHSWGQILVSEGKEIEYLVVIEGEEVIAEALVSYEKLFFGLKYAFSPKGPVVKISSASGGPISNIIETISKYLKDKGCVFWRLEPNINLKSKIENLKLVKVKDVNPSNTLLLNLDKSYDELLAIMHPKTRYNIGLSKKKELRMEEKKDLNIFWELMNKTGQRDAFRLHEKNHYKKVLDSELTFQVIIYFENIPIATGVFVRFGQTFTYLYGASDHEYRALMAPYLAQDFGLNKGKNEGFKYYDFFGIAPVKKDESGEWVYDNNHQYAGVTRFKLGFGGQYFSAPGTFEIVFNKNIFSVFNFVKKLRRIIK